MAKTDRCVVRNAANRRSNLGDRYRHNERHNTNYGNGDIDPERAALNVHFKACEGTYTETFDQLVDNGAVSMRGLGKDPKIVDELVFDVNTDYFDRHGGFDYAVDFFAEAYNLAIKEAGGEQYVLSAVMHADERNKALSEKLGRDVYHYHLHVVYVPVVEKKIYFRRNNKDPALAGKLKETIMQVSHSKKWPRAVQHDEHGEVIRNKDGKAVLVNSYSLLQDRFHEHMRAAGFTDFERGERGSTVQHLDTLEYKIQQDTARAAEKEAEVATLNEQAGAKQKHIATLDKKLTVKKTAAVTFNEIEGMAKRKLSGKVELTAGDWNEVSELAKKGVAAHAELHDMSERLTAAQRNANIYKGRWEQLSNETKEYRAVAMKAPEQTRAALEAVTREVRAERTAAVRKPHRKQDDPER
jgi:hypothetical protein